MLSSIKMTGKVEILLQLEPYTGLSEGAHKPQHAGSADTDDRLNLKPFIYYISICFNFTTLNTDQN